MGQQEQQQEQQQAQVTETVGDQLRRIAAQASADGRRDLQTLANQADSLELEAGIFLVRLLHIAQREGPDVCGALHALESTLA